MVQIISMEGKSSQEQRAERARARTRLLATVAAAQGWPTFRSIIEQNAVALERTVMSEGSLQQDIRVVERAIGKAAGLRAALDLVENEGRRLLRLDAQAKAAAAAREQEQDHGASAW